MSGFESFCGSSAGGGAGSDPFAPNIFPTSAIPKQPRVIIKNES